MNQQDPYRQQIPTPQPLAQNLSPAPAHDNSLFPSYTPPTEALPIPASHNEAIAPLARPKATISKKAIAIVIGVFCLLTLTLLIAFSLARSEPTAPIENNAASLPEDSPLKEELQQPTVKLIEKKIGTYTFVYPEGWIVESEQTNSQGAVLVVTKPSRIDDADDLKMTLITTDRSAPETTLQRLEDSKSIFLASLVTPESLNRDPNIVSTIVREEVSTLADRDAFLYEVRNRNANNNLDNRNTEIIISDFESHWVIVIANYHDSDVSQMQNISTSIISNTKVQ